MKALVIKAVVELPDDDIESSSEIARLKPALDEFSKAIGVKVEAKRSNLTGSQAKAAAATAEPATPAVPPSHTAHHTKEA